MPLDAADLPTLSRLLDEALDLKPAQAEAWLAAMPEEHRHLLPRLRDMLAEHRSQGNAGFMSDGPRLTGGAALADDSVAHAADLIGPYRLIREIGRGGMGAVWLAERADGSLKRQIALKLPRLAWGAGLAERMARERDIGALLEHPNIARLYDAGVDALGRPYLALEYIDGQPLDAWCESHALGVPERLRLFQQVARAVAYAHGRLVVHRDLKPSNVLVTIDGQAHLLDFGIAKLLHEALPGDAPLTQEQGRAMTPHYASPEQIRGEAITVQSDVYSLGVLLYELLAGEYPYSPGRKSLAALEEAILQDEPPLASTRSTDQRTTRQLRGEIDAILAKALKRQPAQRYATADALVEDIERYLNGDTVLAQPDSLRYRFTKSIRRHRVGFAAGGAVLLAIFTGAGVSIVLAKRATEEAERARLVKEFVVAIFDTRGTPDGALGQMPGHALLDRSARLIDKKFPGQPLLQAELYGVASNMFFNMASAEQAVVYTGKQIEALTAAGADRPTIARETLALGELLLPLERNEEAEGHGRRALELALDEPALKARAHALVALALLFGRADIGGAQRELDAADAAVAQGKVPALDQAAVLHARGIWLHFRGDPDDAKMRFDQAIVLAMQAEGPSSRQVLYSRLEATKTLILFGRFDAGRSYLALALESMRLNGGSDDVSAAMWESYATGWLYVNDAIPFVETVATLERDLASIQAQNWPLPEWMAARIRQRIGAAYVRWGDIARGIPLLVDNVEASVKADPLAQWLKRQALVYPFIGSNRTEQAVTLAREMLAIERGWEGSKDLRKTYEVLAVALVHTGRVAEADAVLREYDASPGASSAQAQAGPSDPFPSDARLLVALESRRALDVIDMTDGLVPKPAVHSGELAWLARAAALCDVGRTAEGLGLFADWLPRLATDRYEASPHVAYWRARMGHCALEAGQREQALVASRLASAAVAKQPGVSVLYRECILGLDRRLKRGGIGEKRVDGRGT